MEQWTTIRYLHAQGRGIREVSRELGISRQAVRRALAAESQPRYERPGRANAKLEPFLGTVRELYCTKQLIGSRIYRELRAAGYRGGTTALYDYLRSLKGARVAEKATVRFETEPAKRFRQVSGRRFTLVEQTPRSRSMACPDCKVTEASKRVGITSVGYARFVCRACGRRFNERSGTPFNDLQYPTDIVLNAVLWRLRYKLSLRDVAELLLVRGFTVDPRDHPRLGIPLRSTPR